MIENIPKNNQAYFPLPQVYECETTISWKLYWENQTHRIACYLKNQKIWNWFHSYVMSRPHTTDQEYKTKA